MKEIEVIYLKDNKYNGRKYKEYEDNQADEMYLKVCAKYNDSDVLVIMRKEGEVIKTFRPKYNI